MEKYRNKIGWRCMNNNFYSWRLFFLGNKKENDYFFKKGKGY